MATEIRMKHRETGQSKTGYIGYSWTTLLFGFFPALFRGDFLTSLALFVTILILGAFSAGIGGLTAVIMWSFTYNTHYTMALIEKGYEFCDSEEANDFALRKQSVDGSHIVAIGVVMALCAFDSFTKISESFVPSMWVWVNVTIPATIGMAAMIVGGWKFKRGFWDAPAISESER